MDGELNGLEVRIQSNCSVRPSAVLLSVIITLSMQLHQDHWADFHMINHSDFENKLEVIKNYNKQ